MSLIYSPLRYPGGKNKLSKFVSQICIANNVDGCYVEPYAGGASVALHLLIEGYVSKIIINDIDRSIYAFWHTVMNHSRKLCNLIELTPVTMDVWRNCKRIQQDKNTADLTELGFSTFFLNRTNISGILDAGVIGGINQLGKYKIDCRFNKHELIRRIKLIAKQRKRIEIFNMDALDLVTLIEKRQNNTSTIFYFDPPYYLKGPSLYLNSYTHSDHERVGRKIQQIKNIKWIVSYDNTPEIKNIYSSMKKIEYFLQYTAKGTKKGSEVLFFSPSLTIPNINIIS